MAYLNINNNILSGNTFRTYLTDYGKSRLISGDGFFSAVSKFGLSDNEIDYRKFINSGNCVSNVELSGLTSTCFYDLLDERGGEPITWSVDFGSLASVMVGPRYDVKSGNIVNYDTSLGTNPGISTLWADYEEPISVDELRIPISGSLDACWEPGTTITPYYPSYCTVCADFNGDGKIDINDMKIFLSLLGTKHKEGKELVGDFNGDGTVDVNDLNSFMECVNYINPQATDFCKDKEVFCLACTKLGNTQLCPGDCRNCV